ncbi:MAG: DUF2520 domain-containing protein [Ignavibacteriales bacterium]|nr:DUF2520 domain-containing protein [Ignavibacteriales bacterium]
MPSLRKPLHISIIGAGKVGTSLAVLLHRNGYNITSVISLHRSSAKRCARLVGCSKHSNNIADIAPISRFILIAVPEEKIQEVAQRLSTLRGIDFSRLYVAHTSGVLDSKALKPLTTAGAKTFSLHPIQSFPRSISLAKQLQMLNGIPYGFEGSSKSISFARRIVRALNGRFLVVPKEKKILYHIACVVASNYMVSILGALEEVTGSLKFSQGLKPFKKLILASIENALRDGAARALTGPIVRGSRGTIKLHLNELSGNKKLRTLYRSLGLYTLELARKQRKLTPAQQQTLKKILSQR